MAFTSWSALKTAVLNDLADGNVLTKSYSISGRSHTFRDLSEVAKFISFCDQQIAAESGDGDSVFFYPKFMRPSKW